MGRKFIYDGREFPDPNPSMTPDAVRQHLSNWVPELSNANIKTAKQGEDTIYTFERRVGTKGTL